MASARSIHAEPGGICQGSFEVLRGSMRKQVCVYAYIWMDVRMHGRFILVTLG